MTVMIDLSPEEEARLRDGAQRQGVDSAEYARQLLTQQLAPLPPGAGTLARFAQWEAEDPARDAGDVAARVREWEELKTALNQNRIRAAEEPLFPAA